MRTTATEVPDGWRINGRKHWITSAVGDPDIKMGNNAQLTSGAVTSKTSTFLRRWRRTTPLFMRGCRSD